MLSATRTIAITAVIICTLANAAGAAECGPVLQDVKRMIDQFSPPKDDTNKPKWCAAFAEGLGMIKMGRLLHDECMSEGSERVKQLAEMDRGMRRLQWALDTNCQ